MADTSDKENETASPTINDEHRAKKRKRSSLKKVELDISLLSPSS
jgi:hypothetical protein